MISVAPEIGETGQAISNTEDLHALLGYLKVSKAGLAGISAAAAWLLILRWRTPTWLTR